MGGCLTKDGPPQRDTQQSSCPQMYPSIEDFYQKNKAVQMKNKNPNRSNTSVCVLPTID